MKIKYTELLDQPIETEYKHKFRLSTRAWDIGVKAKSIQELAEKNLDKDGVHAKLYAASVRDWMREIVAIVDECMDVTLDKEAK